METTNNVQRSELWNKIHEKVKQLPRAAVDYDAVDHPSLSTTLEELFLKETEKQPEIRYTLQDIIDAVQYGFKYRAEAQNDGVQIPSGNILQWLMAKKGLIDVPAEFNEYQQKEREASANKPSGNPENARNTQDNIKEVIMEQYNKGNVVVATFEGLQSMPLKEFVKQPVDSILYDLNRSEMIALTFIKDPKWVNDYAVCKVIRELKQQLDEKFTKEDVINALHKAELAHNKDYTKISEIINKSLTENK